MTLQQRVDEYDGPKIYGKVRGQVSAVDDSKIKEANPVPLRRVQVRVPMIDPIEPIGWALVSDPLGPRSNWLPTVLDLVWVEFEMGFVDMPIVTGLICAAEDVSPEFLAEYNSLYANQKDTAGNMIEWTPLGGSPTGPAIHINGTRRLATIDYVTWIKDNLIAWLKTHKHVDSSAVPTPLFPADLADLVTKETDYAAKSAAGAVFGTNKFMAD